MNIDLLAINSWAVKNKLGLKPLKSVVLPICKSNFHHNLIPPLRLGNTNLDFVSKVTNLGYIINSKLSCDDHIKYEVSKIYYTLRNLRVSSDAVPSKTKLILVKQLILPFINYFEVIYSKLDSRSLNILTVALNNVTLFVYGIKRYDHISDYRFALLGCSLEDFLKI